MVTFIDLTRQQELIRDRLRERIDVVLAHGQYIQGPEVAELEQTLARYAGVSHGIACSSGTDALLLCLLAHGVGPGDAVFTPVFSFVSAAEVIALLGATPVFVDIDAQTFNVDPSRLDAAVLSLERGDAGHPLPAGHESLRPRGIIAVDLFGLPADYDAINTLARAHDLFVVEDGAQSFGASRRGRRAGALADLAVTSFFPAKPLGCYGDGGMVFTDDGELSDMIRSLLLHGRGADKYDNVRVGINGRLDTLQAAILLAKMTVFPEELERRQQVAARYGELLGGRKEICLPQVPQGLESAWAQYALRSAHREELMARLASRDIPTAVYYPMPLHLQKGYAFLGYREGDFPVAEQVCREIFSVPVHPYLTGEEQARIAETIVGQKR